MRARELVRRAVRRIVGLVWCQHEHRYWGRDGDGELALVCEACGDTATVGMADDGAKSARLKEALDRSAADLRRKRRRRRGRKVTPFKATRRVS